MLDLKDMDRSTDVLVSVSLGVGLGLAGLAAHTGFFSRSPGEAEWWVWALYVGGVLALLNASRLRFFPQFRIPTIRPLGASAIRLEDSGQEVEEETQSGRPPTPLEQQAVDDLRSLYHSIGKDAWEAAFALLRNARKIIDNPLAPLLRRIEEESELARHRAEDAIENPERVDFEKAIDSFAYFFRMYMRTVRWLHRAASDPSFKSNVESYEPYREWERLHEEFETEAQRVLNRSALQILNGQIQSVGWQKRYAEEP